MPLHASAKHPTVTRPRQAPRLVKNMCSLRAMPLRADVMLRQLVEVSTRQLRCHATEVEGVRATEHDSLRAHALLEGELKRPMMLWRTT